MSAIRVAHVDELPPGKGVTVEVGGHIVTVYNTEGRFYATVEGASGQTAGREAGIPSCTTTASMVHQRRTFDATLPEAPVKGGHEPSLYPHVEGDWVMLTIDDPTVG